MLVYHIFPLMSSVLCGAAGDQRTKVPGHLLWLFMQGSSTVQAKPSYPVILNNKSKNYSSISMNMHTKPQTSLSDSSQQLCSRTRTRARTSPRSSGILGPASSATVGPQWNERLPADTHL